MSVDISKAQPNKRDILKSFGGRVLNQEQEGADKEYLNLDPGLTNQPLANLDIAKQYEETTIDDCLIADTSFKESPKKKLLYTKLLKGDPNPVSLVITKAMWTYKEGEATKIGSSFVLRVRKGNLVGQDERAVIDIENDRKNLIGEIDLRLKEDGTFDIPHRLVREDYRGPQNESRESIGNILLKCSEQIIKSCANKDGWPKSVTMDAGQLDVMLWMDKNGYSPKTPVDQINLDKVYSADESLCIGTSLFVFPASVPEDKRNYANREQAIRVVFNKTIQPDVVKSSEKTSGQDEDIRRAEEERQIEEIRKRLQA
jgi:hypothetical protein